MEMSYGSALLWLCVTAGVMLISQRRHLAAAWDDDDARLGEFRVARRFQRNWLLAFALAQLAQWMQAPYIFRLYVSYGFSHSEIVNFFLITYASSAVLGTVIGAAADRYGRKRGCLLFVVLFTVSTMIKLNAHKASARLVVAHITDGVVLSLLYTSFESWMVSENYVNCYPQEFLHRSFELVSIINGGIAVFAGVLSSVAASFAGNFGPFGASLLPVIFSGILMRNWAENFGEIAGPFRISSAIDFAKYDKKIALLGSAQTFFDSAMYVVRYAWMPALAVTVNSVTNEKIQQTSEEYAIIFAALMISVMIGGFMFSFVRRSNICIQGGGGGYGTGTGKSTSFALVALPAHVAALISLMSTVVFFDSGPGAVFACFVGVEMAYGYFWPCHGVMRSEFLPETHRATLMNLFLVVRNLVVMFALMYNSYLSSLPAIPARPKMHGVVVGRLIVAGAAGAPAPSMLRPHASVHMNYSEPQVIVDPFIKEISQGHNASRELLLVGVSSFALSLLFATLLYQKAKVNSKTAHAYAAIKLDDSMATDDTEFEEDFGTLIDDKYDVLDSSLHTNNRVSKSFESDEDEWRFGLRNDDS